MCVRVVSHSCVRCVYVCMCVMCVCVLHHSCCNVCVMHVWHAWHMWHASHVIHTFMCMCVCIMWMCVCVAYLTNVWYTREVRYHSHQYNWHNWQHPRRLLGVTYMTCVICVCDIWRVDDILLVSGRVSRIASSRCTCCKLLMHVLQAARRKAYGYIKC